MKQRKYMLLAMLAAAALTMTACSNKKADVDTAEAQESPDAYVTEEETGEGDGVYMYKPIAADAFTYGDNVRASGAYRKTLATVYIRRLMEQIKGRSVGRV